jgi:hypothetical protein
MYFVSWKPAIGVPLFAPSRRRAFQSSERVKTLEFQAAVVAKQFVQAGYLKDDRRVVIGALETRALASGTPHIGL